MNQNISNLLTRKVVIPTSVGLAAFSGGAALGYILGKRKKPDAVFHYEKPIGRITSVETDDMGIKVKGEFFPEIVKTNPEMVRSIIKGGTIESLSLHPEGFTSGFVNVIPVEDDPEVTVTAEEDPDWDWTQELAHRDPKEPYVIHKDEFFNEEQGYTQSTVTYYEGDDILVDELNVPIYGFPAMIGELKWGHGSGDENVVYIRNDLLEHEYEVCKDFGRYEVEVLGLEIEHDYQENDLKHSKDRKFRMD